MVIIRLLEVKQSTCLDAAKEEKLRERQSLAQAELDSNSPSVVSIVCSARETMLSVSVLVPPSTWLPLWNTWPLRFLSWPVTPLVTTRRPGSSPVTCNWPSVMTKSRTSSWLESPLLKEVSSPTSKLSFSPRRLKRRLKSFLLLSPKKQTALFRAKKCSKKRSQLI